MRLFVSFLISTTMLSCLSLQVAEQDPVLARVESQYLYRSDLENMMPANLVLQDSVAISKALINAWAKKQLYYQKAQLQLTMDIQNELTQMVDEYQMDLWTQTYKESLVKSTIDTLITEELLKKYYITHAANFKLKEDLVQARFIRLPKNNKDLTIIKERFITYDSLDQRYLDSLSFHFTDYAIRPNQWFNRSELLDRLPILRERDFTNYLKKSQFFFIDQPIEVYLLLVNDYRRSNDTVPFSKIKQTLRKIVFNRRKLEVEKNIDQEILNDAIQTKKFEIYP